MKQSKQENMTYLAVWVALFAAPLLGLYLRTVNDSQVSFQWAEVFLVWRKFAAFLLLFLVHNFLLAPLLVHGHKRKTYFTIVAAIVIVFAVYQCSNRPNGAPMGHRPPMERTEAQQPPFAGPRGEQEGERPPLPDEAQPWGEEPQPRPDDAQPWGDGQPPHGPERFDNKPPLFIGEHDILAVVALILMFAANIGIKGFYRSREDRKRLAELEKKNLEQQLEYLRYQINPHFFMNTLNNIHALVDIDPERAKDTILELSKMMRFVLYEGNRQTVPLTRELEFLSHYVALMQLRYTDKVSITVDKPQEVPDREVPPLLLITFVENAFKHGVSYQHPSFITISIAVSGETLTFKCLNSKAETPNQEKGGVGLQNVKQRLNLIYDNNYTLKIDDATDVYNVELTIPLL